MRIYSITEILEASQNILERDSKTKKKIHKLETNPNSNTPLVLDNPVEDYSINKNVFNYEINSVSKEISNTLNDVNNHNDLEENSKIKNKRKNLNYNKEIIDEIYKLLNKNFRKNTIKIILDQQLENKELKK